MSEVDVLIGALAGVFGMMIFVVFVAFWFRAKTKAIVLGPGREIKFRRLNLGKTTSEGRAYSHGGHSYLFGKDADTWNRKRFHGFLPSTEYAILKDGDPRPLDVKDAGLFPAPYTTIVFNKALGSTIPSSILRPKMDWRSIAIILLVVAVLGLIGLAFGRGV